MASTPTSSPRSQSTTMTTPPALSLVQPQASPNAGIDNDTSDIWASDSPPSGLSYQQGPPAPTPELSDLPSLRRQHITSGYREGLSVGKARVIQSAFDQGYPLGMSFGLRIGTILGALEGLVTTPSVRDDEARVKRVAGMLESARRELDVKKLLEGTEEQVVAEAQSVEGLESVEENVRRWEEKVLSGFQRDRGDGKTGKEVSESERVGRLKRG